MTALPPIVTVPSGSPTAPTGGQGFIKVVCASNLKPADFKWRTLPAGVFKGLNEKQKRPAGEDDVGFRGTPHPAAVLKVPVIAGKTTVITVSFTE